jgi:molecular chaperone GrpE
VTRPEDDSRHRGDGAAPGKQRAPLRAAEERSRIPSEDERPSVPRADEQAPVPPEDERSPAPSEDELVTARDESGEPAGDEDPAVEAERDAARDEAEADEAEREEDPLARAERERDEYLALAQRAQADFENYRKRAAREAAAAGARARSGLVRELLPVVDNLERALASASEEEQHLAEGVRLVHSELIAVLERNGVEQFDPRGETFDPTVHEALSTRAEDGAEPGVVLDVVEKGYRTGDAVLRPARVVVSG